MLRAEFSDCVQAAETFNGLGYGVKAVQLEQGPLTGSIEVREVGGVLFARYFNSRMVLFQGDALPGYSPFSWCSAHGSEAHYHGASHVKNAAELCGFNKGLETTDCHFVGEMKLIYMPKESLSAHFVRVAAFKALERFEGANSCETYGQSFCVLHGKGMRGQLNDVSQVYDYITSTLEDPDAKAFDLSAVKNSQVLAGLVALAHKTAEGEPLTLPKICQMLLVSRSTLSAACRDTYGLSVGSLFRMVRLEQCRLALRDGWSVATVMKRYRFTNRGKFAAYYKAAFGVLPSGQIELFGPDCPKGVVS